MTARLFLTLGLGLLVAGQVSAAKPKKEKKQAKQEVAEQKAPAADIASVDDFSYAFGVAQSGNLKKYLAENLKVDTTKNMADVLRGIEAMKNPTPEERAYAAGVQIGSEVFRDFVPRLNQAITGKSDTTFINEDRYKQGFIDAVSSKAGIITVDSAGKLVNKQMAYYTEQRTEATYAQNRKDGEEFLKANAKLPEVKTTSSGLQYRIIKEGSGPVAKEGQSVKVNYEGRTIDGKVFDTTKGKTPFVANPKFVIKGWGEALSMMPAGSKWEIFIPYQLAYGDREAGQIKPYSALIFEIEALEIVDQAKN